MNYEQFLASPTEGTADPLALYFHSPRLQNGGGLTGFRDLSAQPYDLHLQLNEWVRFDKPGTYRISVISHRIADLKAAGENGRRAFFDLTSNTLTLQIVPADPAWQQVEFVRIRRVLDEVTRGAQSIKREERALAIKSLRYLGTAEAAREMADRLPSANTSTGFDWEFGLIASPNRLEGLREMERLLPLPNIPVTQMFLEAMSEVSSTPMPRRNAFKMSATQI